MEIETVRKVSEKEIRIVLREGQQKLLIQCNPLTKATTLSRLHHDKDTSYWLPISEYGDLPFEG